MTRRVSIALVVAALFFLVNVGGAWYALTLRELPHAVTHAGLALLGAWAIGQLAARRIQSY